MSTLLMTLEGPLQSWGSRSRFVTRATERAPTKSGVIGLLAAAKGLRRTDPLTELLSLRFGVRIDQPGRLIRDFQTERTLDGKDSMPLSYRYYLGDAVFIAGVQSDDVGLLESLKEAVSSPYFPLYLGRRSCPPAGPIKLNLVAGVDLESAMQAEPWAATARHQKSIQTPTRQLEVLIDGSLDDENGETFRDDPISFDPERREYGWRQVVSIPVEVDNPKFVAPKSPFGSHDPMSLVSEAG